MGYAKADVLSLKMDVYFSLQGSCTLADNFVFRIIMCFQTNPMVCDRGKVTGKLGCLTDSIHPVLSGALASTQWERDLGFSFTERTWPARST